MPAVVPNDDQPTVVEVLVEAGCVLPVYLRGHRDLDLERITSGAGMDQLVPIRAMHTLNQRVIVGIPNRSS
ncbi:hypothetical protein [Arcanobacterium phocae]|uniref:hypothetical protein n=1 Tax=Arcanobacterium phocae TaxID=131112 RepID=UPI001C0EBB7C|nr:hypothetical protein [Arcanobacterium phocae]